MPQFISLSTFSPYYGSPAELMDSQGLAAFNERLSHEVIAELSEKVGCSQEALVAFKQSLDQAEKVLFYGWIIQNPILEKFLTHGVLGNFEDRGGHLKHQLASSFRRFLTPFLAEQLLKHTAASDSNLAKAFTFIPLLDDDHTAAIEGQLFRSIEERVAAAKLIAKSFRTEEELLALVQDLCSNDVLFCVNQLSRKMYATRMTYVDDILSLIRGKACSARLANWILKQMERIRLNNEHAYKLEFLRVDLAKGDLRVRNTLEKKKIHTPWKRIFLGFFLLVIIGLAWWLTIYQPFSHVDPVMVADDTSFEQFSPEERERIDSLLEEMSGQREQEDLLDQGLPILGNGTSITLRKAFYNTSLEGIYQDFLLDASLQEKGFSDSCTQDIPFQRLLGTGKLEKRTGTLAAMFRNGSKYDAILLVAPNDIGGSVYSAMLKAGETKVLNLEQGDILVLIAGRNFQKYQAPSGADPSELPSSNFTEHFCTTDFNYGQTMNAPYEVFRTIKGKTKFLISGALGDDVELIDIYNVLEEW